MNEIKGLFILCVMAATLITSAEVWAESFQESSSSITFPSDPVAFQQGRGSDIASSYCLICHSAEYVYMQPPHHEETWTKIVHKMKSAFGCPIPEEQISPLVSYLISQNHEQPTLATAQSTQEIASTPSKGNAEKGRRVYQAYCANCHGPSGKGDGPIGQVLIPAAADLTATTNKRDEDLLKTIRHGRPGTAMPSWKNDLTPQEILDVLIYIRSLG